MTDRETELPGAPTPDDDSGAHPIDAEARHAGEDPPSPSPSVATEIAGRGPKWRREEEERSEGREAASADRRSAHGPSSEVAANATSPIDTTVVGGPGLPPGAAATDLWSTAAPPPVVSASGTLKSDFSDWLKERASLESNALDDTVNTLSEIEDDMEAPVLPTAVEEVYVDRGEIGHGGMGSVIRVFDRRLRREAALKILKPEVGSKHREVRRFVEEAQITGQLDHPNIVPIHELGQDAQGSHYFTMKLVQGRNLEEALSEAGTKRLEAEGLADFLQIFVKVCEAVSFAHSRGVVHRDLKPANIMVGEYGQVYVMDWGIARLMSVEGRHESHSKVVTVSRSESTDIDTPGTIVGTPRYMAPEQVAGDHEATDQRADIFALGGTLYHILTGHAPYTEQNYFSLLVSVQNCEIVRPLEIAGCEDVPAELERIAMKAMARDPDERYPSVVDLQKDVERFMRGVWHLPTEHYPAGTAIIREGDEGDEAYIIKSGRCRVLKNVKGKATELRSMGPGDVFGETAIFSAGKRSATVEAVDDVEVTVVTSEILTQGLGLNSWMGSFVRALASRFREVDHRLHGKPADE